ncbi:MAG: ABC transporter permease [Rhodospirillaceae bacterium]|nr:ABC transporter permease [Rhodospirillaceae bacterium]
MRAIMATARMQIRLASRSIESVMPLLVMPLQSVVALAILAHSGRLDLAGYALCAALLLTVGQMGLFIGSEIVAHDRRDQILELLVATPTPYINVLATRTILVSSFGLAGFVEAWLIARLIFGVTIEIHHSGLMAIALAATVLAGGGTAVLTSALFSLARTTRTLQNATNGPFYVLGGVLVPVSFLPVWLQPLSPLIFFTWSANLVRSALAPEPPQDAAFQLGMLLALGAGAALLGVHVMRRMLDKLRHDGRLGLT